ncbi:MAG: NAC family transcription factor [Methanospirillum sp.]|nr:NAC family transcription factor [Methanospirillum sp.]
MDGKDGSCCTICGGIPPERISIRRTPVDGRETGIDRLDRIIDEVRRLRLSNDESSTGGLLKRTRALNHVPTRLAREYGDALLREHRNREA